MASTSPLFTKLPLEVLQKILRLAFGVQFVHVELDYEQPPAKVRPKQGSSSFGHAGRYSIRKPDSIPSPVSGYGLRRWYLEVHRQYPRRWRWFNCVCHRINNHFEVQRRGDEPYRCQCKFGDNEWCHVMDGDVPYKCQLGAMGWLLSCRQGYTTGINVLYSTNTFHLANTELILNMPKLIPDSSIKMITAIEMRWKIHPFRGQDTKDPPLSNYEAFSTLVNETPRIFCNIRRLYLSLQGDLFLPGEPEGLVTEARKFDKVEKTLIQPVEEMLRKLQRLKIAIIAVPSSAYRERKRRAMRDGIMMTEWRHYHQERHWRPLQNASIDGYWMALGHKDLKQYPRTGPGCYNMPPTLTYSISDLTEIEGPMCHLHDLDDSPWA